MKVMKKMMAVLGMLLCIIPFCTHGGSGFSRSISDIEEERLEGTAVLEGFSVYGTEAEDAGQEVENWLKNGSVLGE